MVGTATRLSPAEQMLSTASRLAAWPEVVQRAPIPPSRAAIFSSTAATVGLEMREYMCPGALKSKRAPTWSVESYL